MYLYMYDYVRIGSSSITSGHDVHVDVAYQAVVVGRSVHKLAAGLLSVRLNPVVKSCDVLPVFTNLTLDPTAYDVTSSRIMYTSSLAHSQSAHWSILFGQRQLK